MPLRWRGQTPSLLSPRAVMRAASNFQLRVPVCVALPAHVASAPPTRRAACLRRGRQDDGEVDVGMSGDLLNPAFPPKPNQAAAN